MLLSLSCGGGGGTSAPASINSVDLSGVNIYPKPELHSRQLHKIQVNGETYRLVEEVTASQAGAFETRSFLDGMFTGNLRTSYETVSSNVFVLNQINDQNAFIYEAPGSRQWLPSSELPFSERISYISQSLIDATVFGPYLKQRTLISLGDAMLTVDGVSLPVNEREERTEYFDVAGNLLSTRVEKSWFHESKGALKIEVTEGSSVGLLQVVEKQETNHDQAFTFGASSLNKSGYGMIVDFSNLSPVPHAAHLREIYELGLTLSELPSSAVVPATTVQALFLYRQHYLYPFLLPTGLAEVPSLASYVSDLRSNDPFTYYFSATTNDVLQSRSSGASSTIGLELGLPGLTSLTGQEIISSSVPVTITGITPLSRAYYDDLQVNDILLAIDDVELAGQTFQQVVDRLPTLEEQTVKFLIQRGTQTLTIQTAAEENMAWFLSDGTLYVNVRTFTEKTGLLVKGDVDRLKAQQSFSKIILDLRSNGGGRTSGARDLLDYLGNFDDPVQGTLMYRTTPQLQEYAFGQSMSENIGVYGAGNVVILVDGNSASASEMVAGTLKLLGGATILGERSYVLWRPIMFE